MFSVFAFAVLLIGGINAENEKSNDFEIRHLIELGSDSLDDGIEVKDIAEDVTNELDELICTSYTEKGTKCSIDGKFLTPTVIFVTFSEYACRLY